MATSQNILQTAAKTLIQMHLLGSFKKKHLFIQTASELTEYVLTSRRSHRTAETWDHSLPHPAPQEMKSAKTSAKTNSVVKIQIRTFMMTKAMVVLH